MKFHRRRFAGVPVAFSVLGCAAALCAVMAPAMSYAQGVRSQTVRLEAGWNAVYLEVDPLVSEPAELFADGPVDVVAAFTASTRGAQFVQNPSADQLRAYGWRVWYAPRRADAFLSRLAALNGGTPYLVHSREAISLEIPGRIPPARRRWVPDAYNFVGFSVDAAGGPTFQQFFEGSPAHRHNRIYRMRNGVWRQVLDPAGETMRSGEAFWIYTEGASEYTGPLQVRTRSPFGLVLSPGSGQTLVLRNRAPHPLTVTVEHVVAQNDEIPLALAVNTLNSTEARSLRSMSIPLAPGAWSHTLPVFEAGEALRLPFEVRRAGLGSGTRHSLLRVRTDLGTQSYLSVTAFKEPLSTPSTH